MHMGGGEENFKGRLHVFDWMGRISSSGVDKGFRVLNPPLAYENLKMANHLGLNKKKTKQLLVTIDFFTFSSFYLIYLL